MGRRESYGTLLQPLRLKHLELRNRMVKAAYSSTNCDERGYVLDSAVHHYDAVARGGVGLFLTESVAMDPLGVTGSPRMAIWDDCYIPGQKRLVDAVHRHGTPILMQIHHAGPSYSTGAYGSWSGAEVERLAPRAASSLAPEQLPGPRPNAPQALTRAEIAELIGKYTRAAERAAEAGFDGVELHFAVTYLMNSFFSRAWNKRNDEYGGTLENRVRFAASIVHGVRRSLGDRFIVAALINDAEHGTRHGDGITHEESREIARLLEQAGVDLLEVKTTGYNDAEWIGFPEQVVYPEVGAGMQEFAKAVKRGTAPVGAEAIGSAVSIPVIANGGLTFESAERLLRQGRVELVSFARALIADPEAPNKLHEGRVDDICRCTRCQTCFDAFMRSEHERCRVNAAFAKEGELQIVPAVRAKKVLVIGGGPSGMVAARVAALRGHAVSLYEQRARLGGLVPLASLIKSTEVEDLPGFIAWLERQLHALGVRIECGRAVDAALVRQMAPDVAIIASGSRPRLPEIPGIESKNVVTSLDLQARAGLPMQMLGASFLDWATKVVLPLGRRIVIVGGQIEGAQLAEFLVKRGREVVMTETAHELGTGLLAFHRARLLDWLQAKGATLLAGVRYERITDEGVGLVTREGERRFFHADTVIVLALREPDHSLHEQIGERVPEVHLVGDCKAPGMIVDAVESGHRVGCAI